VQLGLGITPLAIPKISAHAGCWYSPRPQKKVRDLVPTLRSSEFQWHPQRHPSLNPWQGFPSGIPGARRRCWGAPRATQGQGQPRGSGTPEADQRGGPSPGLRVSFFEQKQKGSALPLRRESAEGTERRLREEELELGRESDFDTELERQGSGGA